MKKIRAFGTEFSKFIDLLVMRWKESKLQKARFSLSMLTLAWLVVNWAGVPLSSYLIGPLVMCQIFLTFYPNIMGQWVRPLIARWTHLVPMDGETQIVTEYHHDASWHFFEMTPELHAWYKENCEGWMGTLPQRQMGADVKRTFWFTNANDAFAFRMRWAGL
ncbi:MAG: hypothetical protein EOP83_10900 [Verrucomicrobiaceae bacterium]|nr:MAG: hypothetical protein EOP83_10900 [Verrucomicrobiaceae bacterium]